MQKWDNLKYKIDSKQSNKIVGGDKRKDDFVL